MNQPAGWEPATMWSSWLPPAWRWQPPPRWMPVALQATAAERLSVQFTGNVAVRKTRKNTQSAQDVPSSLKDGILLIKIRFLS